MPVRAFFIPAIRHAISNGSRVEKIVGGGRGH